MNKFDWSDLDARLLRWLVAVVDAGSVTGAAHALGVTQSAVSHQLERLRLITGDPLFVKSGRGIVATARAQALAHEARELLRQLQSFVHVGAFDPGRWQQHITIAANDLQRDVLLPALMQRLRHRAPDLSLRVIPSGVPSLDMLRLEQCQVLISPRPPNGTDVLQKRLFEDGYRVFYDPKTRTAPQSMTEYLQAQHVTVVYEPRRLLDIDQWLLEQGVQRQIRVSVPGFAGLAAFLQGSDWLATGPALLERHLLRGLASAPLPLPCPRLPMYLVWHRRYHHDPAHQWLRSELEAVAQEAAPSTRPAA